MKPLSPFAPDAARPFKLARFLSWGSLVLIMATSILMSAVLANSARETLLAKQREFALLLAENLNHQIFQRYTVPTLLAFGRIELQRDEQYHQLDKVIRETIHGQHVMELRIYDLDGVVSYSTVEGQAGAKDLASATVRQAAGNMAHSFEIVTNVSPWRAMIHFDLDAESVVMRTVYPLKTERSLFPGGPSGQPMGILEFSQDITDDYRAAINFQWVIIAISFTSSFFLFLLLLLFIRRADALNLQRMQRTQKLERELLQAERLASMGRVVAGIAHEIRNPLGIIQSSAEMLLKKARAENSPRTTLLQVMFDEIRRLSQTVNDFLDYARPKKPRREDVDLALLLDQACTFLEHEFTGKGVTLVRDYPPGLRTTGDKDLLYRALYNIMVNAMQAMDGGGTLTIRGRAEGGAATLLLLDTGPGFSEEVAARLTDPFFTTKDSGTGLGLAIVANILDSHGAGLEFANAPGGGAQVSITFPASEETAHAEQYPGP
ncbi:ATP-binding protein [Desulfocurvus sp.]|jgi:signal transduction histidine kinase|uniref:sensor histidine kinase n=1 Tax=Desulfocurvus sp. TaxID=2871698 RepID=UPI0025C589E0|nr:ATP-binding protein [Desulfocurvus sp.]MCK9239136.1 ATP-binding protein [Desulfocurvus sp.]